MTKEERDGSFSRGDHMGVLHEEKVNQLNYYVCSNRETMGRFSAKLVAEKINELLKGQKEVRMIFASAPSQNEFLHSLITEYAIDWSRVVGFHMDEYIGLSSNAEQWFKKYLERKILDKITLKEFHFIDGTKDPNKEMNRYENLLREQPIDLVCLGVGENGHIAFNDPPVADFNDSKMIKKVVLDQFSRQQQVNDGCFETIEAVPTHALTLTIPTLIEAKTMVCTVPGARKREAIANVLRGEISTNCPATILRKHKDSHLIVDAAAGKF